MPSEYRQKKGKYLRHRSGIQLRGPLRVRRPRSIGGSPGIRGAVLAVGFLLACGGTLPGRAETAGTAESSLSIHGFLSQAYGVSDDHQISGIPPDGTFELRAIALQFRYMLSRKDILVVQLNHERSGESKLNTERSEIALDWAYYERRFSASSSIKIGRVPLPFGAYNEIRDVGTILPFFRAPLSIYGEAGQATVISQNVDGALFSHHFDPSPWSIDLSLYSGEWNSFVPRGPVVTKERYDNVAGVQFWFNTPSPGIRFGVAANRFKGAGLFSPPDLDFDYESLLLSAEIPVGRFLFGAEYFEVKGDFEYVGYYALVGYRITDLLSVFAQAENADFDLVLPVIGPLALDFNEEWAVGVGFHVSPELVVKLEVHLTEGFAVEDVPNVNPFGPPFETNFGIVSLAVSF